MNIDQVMLKFDIESDIRRIENVLNSDVFAPTKEIPLLCSAAFTELIVCLNDLLQKARGLNVPVTFADDIPIELTRKDGKPVDVTDFVNMVRNTVCHISSKNLYTLKSEQYTVRTSFVTIYGKVANIFLPDGTALLEGKYDDDFCFNFGNLNLYYHRHILKAFDEAKQNLLPLISNKSFTQ